MHTAKSIVQIDMSHCYLCGRKGGTDPLEIHHIFFGPNRKHSDEDGCIVALCGERCHRNGKVAAHRFRPTDLWLKEEAQTAWEKTYGDRDAFRARYGKSYL